MASQRARCVCSPNAAFFCDAVILMILALGSLTPAVAFSQTPGEVRIGERLPDATMQGLNGPPRRLSAFRGTPLIINVWASWCGPCRAEMASLERLAWRDGSEHFNVIGISTDDCAQQGKAALGASNATIAQFIDSGLRMERMLGASRLPLTVLVDADGRVVRKVYSAREWDSPNSLKLIAVAFGHRQSSASD
jgi:thiol-disulfide isomerase/thioredoxin